MTNYNSQYPTTKTISPAIFPARRRDKDKDPSVPVPLSNSFRKRVRPREEGDKVSLGRERDKISLFPRGRRFHEGGGGGGGGQGRPIRLVMPIDTR